MKGKKSIIVKIVLVLLVMILLASVASAGFRTLWNPWTNALDFIHDTDYSGENIYLDEVDIGANLTVHGYILVKEDFSRINMSNFTLKGAVAGTVYPLNSTNIVSDTLIVYVDNGTVLSIITEGNSTLRNWTLVPSTGLFNLDSTEWDNLNFTLDFARYYMPVNLTAGEVYIDDDLYINGNITAGDSIFGDGDNVRVGDAGADSHSLVDNDDLFVSGKLEVDGISYFDATMYVRSQVQTVGSSLGSAGMLGAGFYAVHSSQTPNTAFFGLGSVSNNMLIIERRDLQIDFAHPQQDNPTLFIQSNGNTSVDEWIGFQYINSSNEGVISVGTGGIVLNGTNYTQIGDDGSSNRGLDSGDDLFINGKLEIDGATTFDSTVTFYAQPTIRDALPLNFGNDADSKLFWNTAQTPDALTLSLGTDSRSLIIVETGDHSIDFAHPQQDNPTLFIQSNGNTSLDEWLSLTYINNSNSGVISVGTGGIVLNGTNYTQVGDGGSSTHSLVSGDDLFINGAFEVDGVMYSDSFIEFEDATNYALRFKVAGTEHSEINAVSDGGLYIGLTGLANVDNNAIVIGRSVFRSDNRQHDTLSRNPTLFIHSENNMSYPEWISFAFINSSQEGMIATGNGSLTLAPYNKWVNISGNITGASINWTAIQNYPIKCPSGAITALGDSVTCSDPWLNVSGTMNITGNLTGIDSIIGANSNNVRIGDAGADSHSLASNDDLFISGKLEIDGITYFDSNVVATRDITLYSNYGIYAATTKGVVMPSNAYQTLDTLALHTGSEGNYLLISEYQDFATDFAHPLQSDPTIYIQSSSNISTDEEWLSLSYVNESNYALIQSGAGNIMINGSNYTMIGSGSSSSHSLVSNDDLFVNGILEVEGISWFDSQIIVAGSPLITANNIFYTDALIGAYQPSNTHQTVGASFLLTGSTNNYLGIRSYSLRTDNLEYPKQADPTLFIHSNDSKDITEWISFAYLNASQVGKITTGNGSLLLEPNNKQINASESNLTNVKFINNIVNASGLLSEPPYIFSHTDAEQPITSPGVWVNISFNESADTIISGITHTHNDQTNDTFTISESGIYNFAVSLNYKDSAANPADSVAVRVWEVGVGEIIGSIFEKDTTKQNAIGSLHHIFKARLTAGSEIKMQATGGATTISFTNAGTYGDHRDVATIDIERID